MTTTTTAGRLAAALTRAFTPSARDASVVSDAVRPGQGSAIIELVSRASAATGRKAGALESLGKGPIADARVAVQGEQPLMNINRGVRINAGPDRATSGYGWQVNGLMDDGRVSVLHNDGKSKITPHTIPAGEFLTLNPRFLDGAIVAHPAPPAGLAAEGWNVIAIRDATIEVTLRQGDASSIVPAKSVIEINLDALRSRLRVIHDS